MKCRKPGDPRGGRIVKRFNLGESPPHGDFESITIAGKDFPLGLVGDAFAGRPAELIGGGVFALVVYLLYRWASRLNNPVAGA